MVLILGVCAPLIALCDALFSDYFSCFLSRMISPKIFVPSVSSLQSLTLGTRSVFCSIPLILVSDTGHKSAPLWII
ncbi:hypothetical protein SCLCIDRAFT_21229 [Scleroderma citrinum Foug A]|uniref:Secreted protein n=1 Tax=Scleroderma citrinum Foug A TaxID=1036808 RepID=A0A0C3AR00_9AGAM|nr:hypothetical protein SCLCIDRAFT_21229 [Scleroderma citrinum Foug A]